MQYTVVLATCHRYASSQSEHVKHGEREREREREGEGEGEGEREGEGGV